MDNQENPWYYVIAQQYARVIARVSSRRDAPVVSHEARPPLLAQEAPMKIVLTFYGNSIPSVQSPD